MAAEGAVWALGQAPPDLAVEPFPLPVRHRDVPGERLEQRDIALGVVDLLPVEVPDMRDLEQPAGLDLVCVHGYLARARPGAIGRQPLADLVVHLLELLEERIAVVGYQVRGTPERQGASGAPRP